VTWRWREAEAEAAARARDDARAALRAGLLQAAAGWAAAMVLRWVFHRPVLAAAVVVLATVAALLAIASPLHGYAALRRGLARFGSWLGAAVRWLLMPLVFYGLFLPFGLLRRATGKARRMVPRGPDPALDTYWKRSPARTAGAQRYERQF
jgi:hypothetical protein